MTASKKHHYVPQSLLKRFSIDNAEKQIHVYDKIRKYSFSSSIIDAGSENHFNTLTMDGKSINFESVFQNNDYRLAEIIKIITDNKHLNGLTDKDRFDLYHIIAAQLVRTKMFRTSMHSFAEQMSECLYEAGINPGDVSNFEMPSEQNVRKAALISFLNLNEVASALRKKIFLLISCTKGEHFWISDNPVVLHNTFPYGERGLNSPGIEIYHPISSELALGYWCPSILNKVESLLKLKIAHFNHDFYLSMFNAIKKGVPVSLGPKTTSFLNSLQILHSSRFLYSSDSDFSLANNVLEKNPHASNIKTLMKVGKLGRGHEPRKAMPKGVWVVVYGNSNHFMISASNWQDYLGFLEFETEDIDGLNLILKDQPLKQVVLFEDGYERKGMRNVKFELSVIDSVTRVTVKHIDESLNNLLSKLGK